MLGVEAPPPRPSQSTVTPPEWDDSLALCKP